MKSRTLFVIPLPKRWSCWALFRMNFRKEVITESSLLTRSTCQMSTGACMQSLPWTLSTKSSIPITCRRKAREVAEASGTSPRMKTSSFRSLLAWIMNMPKTGITVQSSLRIHQKNMRRAAFTPLEMCHFSSKVAKSMLIMQILKDATYLPSHSPSTPLILTISTSA